jgi:hypothetical protein
MAAMKEMIVVKVTTIRDAAGDDTECMFLHYVLGQRRTGVLSEHRGFGGRAFQGRRTLFGWDDGQRHVLELVLRDGTSTAEDSATGGSRFECVEKVLLLGRLLDFPDARCFPPGHPRR